MVNIRNDLERNKILYDYRLLLEAIFPTAVAE